MEIKSEECHNSIDIEDDPILVDRQAINQQISSFYSNNNSGGIPLQHSIGNGINLKKDISQRDQVETVFSTTSGESPIVCKICDHKETELKTDPDEKPSTCCIFDFIYYWALCWVSFFSVVALLMVIFIIIMVFVLSVLRYLNIDIADI